MSSGMQSPQGLRDPRFSDAQLARYESETEQKALAAADKSRQVEAEIELKRTQQDAENRDQEMKSATTRYLLEEESKAKISNDVLWTAVAIEDRRRKSVTTMIERFFFMGVVAIGVIATVVLAFTKAHQQELAFQLSPLSGIVLSGLGGISLRLLRRDEQARMERAADEERVEVPFDF
jgi:Fe2+ transport system protein B